MSNFPEWRYRALFLLSPKLANKRYAEHVKRQEQAAGERRAGDVRMSATGYGNNGASTTKSSLLGWLAGGGSAEDDIDLHGSLLRRRGRDLYAGGGLARSGPDVLATNVVGWGIQPKPKIDAELLGMSDEECETWERATLREFRLWAESRMCDAERSKDFYAMQQLAFLSMLMSGDVFALMGNKENKATPYTLTVRLLEADRICTPDSANGESESVATPGGGRIVDGVEIDGEGAVVRYHIANRHPMAENAEGLMEWTAVDAFGKDTGEPIILHVAVFERPEQRRGIPYVSAVIESVKQLDRYVKYELAAQVVAAMFTGFIETSEDDGKYPLDEALADEEKVTDDELHYEMAPGVIYKLPPGAKPSQMNPMRTNTGFADFVTALETHIGAGMGIPKEVLIKKYDSNYTAARSALLDFWKLVRVYRTRFVNLFCQPVYEQWLAEAVAIGRVKAPGFFDDPLTRKAWCGCMWMGTSMGHVDPLKEVNAAARRIELNMTTQEQEASEYNGNDWNANIRQRKKEQHALDDGEGGGDADMRADFMAVRNMVYDMLTRMEELQDGEQAEH